MQHLAINEIHDFVDTSCSYEPLVAHKTSCGMHSKTFSVSCPDCPIGIRYGPAIQQYGIQQYGTHYPIFALVACIILS